MRGAALVVLPRETFARGAVEVAPVLLGCVLEHESPEGLVAVALTEVEAYQGAADPASHAYHGRTARNAVMFGPPGHAYVYFTYGMHFCVNLVCLPEGTASAVLLRAGRVVEGVPLATARRARGRTVKGEWSGTGRRAEGGDPAVGPAGSGGAARAADRDLARGPARLCQALGIDRAQDGADVCDPGSPLRVRWPDPPGNGAGEGAGRPGRTVDAGPDVASWRGGARPGISQGPRVGISSAAERPWRFWLTGDPTVSAYRPYVPRRRPGTVN
jgi:DNA-3-methyladenine glycosylase